MKAILYSLSFAFLFALSPGSVSAQTPCGSIIGSDALPSDHISILDCNNPFGVTSDPSNPYTVRINGQDIEPGATVALPEGRAYSVSHSGTPHYSHLDTEIFKHVGNNYERVNLTASEPTPGDYEEFAQTYFGTEAERTRYIEIVIYNFEHTNLDDFFYDSVSGDALIDETTGETVESRYYDFIEAFEDGYVAEVPTLGTGTYTMLFYEYQLELVESTLWDVVRDFLIPTAYAQCAECFPPHIYTITFTITEAPAGASSILFLPGIMGSHLYEDSGECFGFGEQKRWFSHTDCEQLRLLTNTDGSSINDIYTRFEDEAIADKASLLFFTQELYTSFLARMNALEGNEIKDFTPFPYDWRLKLDQVIRMKKDSDSTKVRYIPGTSLQDGLLYKTISDMAARSHSGKVTIVTHSNGGLVAKAFMAELAEVNDPLEAKIDNLILIGSPQVGTPDAVNGILHGTEIGPGGVVINQDTTRRILNTAPFGHHLLPNQHYFDGEGVSVDTPVINFKEGLATNVWRTQYGESIDSFEELKRFLDDSSGRVKPVANDLKTPEVVEGALLNYAEEVGDKLADWQPPSTLTVHQLGGSGIWTPSRVEYSSERQCTKYYPVGFGCYEYSDYAESKLHFVIDGDGTVVLPSALTMSENEKIKRWWLDLYKYNDEKDREEKVKIHKNMLEVPEVTTYVANIASSKTSDYAYITNTLPTVPSDIRLLFHLHSPLDMYVTSDQGVVSSTTNEVSGAFYRRYGDVQYISLPGYVTNATLHLIGYEEGSFSLYKEIWQGEEELTSVDFKALPTSSSTVVTLTVSFNEAGVMQVDFNGDGEVDGTVFEQEDIIKAVSEGFVPEPEVEERENHSNSGTRVNKNSNGMVAGVSTNQQVEQLKEIIRLLNLIIKLLQK